MCTIKCYVKKISVEQLRIYKTYDTSQIIFITPDVDLHILDTNINILTFYVRNK